MPEPSVIGKYRIEGRLGQGGMGAVYLARDPRIGRLVALKVLRLDNEEMRKRFELEAQSAGRLKHPNIVTIYDYEEYDGNPCLAMEYVEGHTLAEMIQRGDPLPISQRLDFVEQVCRGLAYAHAAGIVHRDIKPSNLMVDQHGVMKILDFGIARNAERGLTRSRRMVGTAGYMSPEQVRGDKVDQRCDVFAVGLVLYEFLTGRRAFPGENEYSVFDRILNGSPDPFDHPDARVIQGVSPILDAALARLPENRYQTATALGADLATLRQRFDAGTDSSATAVMAEPAIKTPTPRPPADDQWPPRTPLEISPDHTPTREATSQGAREPVPPRAKTEPAAVPVAAAPRSRAAVLAAVAWIALAVVVGAQYVWPLMTAPAPSSESTPAGAVPSNTAPAPAAEDTGKPAAPPVAVDPTPAKPVDQAPFDSAGASPGVAQGRPAPPRVTDEIARAVRAFENGDYTRAIEEYNAALKIDPGNKAAADGLATVRRAMQAEKTILSSARPPAPVSTPESRRLAGQHVAEGQKLFLEGQYDPAIKAFEAAQALEPADKLASDGIAQVRKAKAAEEAIMRGRMRKPPP
jgi:serine/threonine-protein kinase